MCACMCLEEILLKNFIFSDSGFRRIKRRMGWRRHSSLGEPQAPWLQGVNGVSRSSEARPRQSRKLTPRKTQFITWQGKAVRVKKLQPCRPGVP